MKKFTLLFIIILILYSCNIIRVPFYANRISKWSKKAQVVNAVQHDTIPFEIIGNWPIATLAIAGEERKYVLDTGAPTVLDYSDVFNDRIVTKPKLEKKSDNLLDIFKAKFYLNMNKIDTVDFGNTQYSEVGALTADFKFFSDRMSCENITGILGINVMKHGVWSFDYSSGRVIVSSEINNFDLENSFVFDLLEIRGFEDPIIRLNVEGKSLITLIDTGNANYSILLNDRIINKFEGQMIRQAHISNKLLVEQMFVSKEIDSDSSFLLNLNTKDLNNSYSFIASNPHITTRKALKEIDMIMGYDFLKDFITTFDWSNKKVYFQPIQKHTIETNKTSKNMDIYFHIYDKKVYVFNYLDDYFPNGGINIGDTVKAINHIPIEEIVNKENYCEIVRDERELYPSQDTTIITVKNKKGETRDLKMFDIKLFD